MVWPRPGRMPGASRAGRILTGLGAFALLAACSSSPTTPAPSSTASSSPTSAPSVSGSELSPLPGAATVLEGTIQAGVESGCIVLVDETGAVLANLIGLDASSAPTHSSVTVTGKFQADLITTCQQGEPFVVAAVAPK